VHDDRQPGEERGGGARFDAAPVQTRWRVPRVTVVVVATAVVAFFAGIAWTGPVDTLPAPADSRPPATDSLDDALLSAAPVVPASPMTAPGAPGDDAAPPAVAGASTFLAGFDPATVLPPTPDGRWCRIGGPRDKLVPRTRRDGPRLTFQRSWVAWCPLAAADRQTYLVEVFARLPPAVPAETYGFSAGLDGGGDALLPYAEPPFAGTVSIAADEAGRGLAIAVVAEEWVVEPQR